MLTTKQLDSMKQLLTFLIFTIFATQSNSQAISIAFTANESCSYVAFDSVKIENITSNSTTVLYFPDTVLSLNATNAENISNFDSNIPATNYPNPFIEKTSVNVYLPKKEKLSLSLFTATGNEVARYTAILNQGLHQFEVSGKNSGIYFLKIGANNRVNTIKLIQLKRANAKGVSLKYSGITNQDNQQINYKNEEVPFSIDIGDEILITGFYEHETMTINDTPEEDIVYHLDFDHPECPESVTDIRDGYIYPVQKIGCQCWMAENLRFLPSVSAGANGAATYEHYYVYGYHGSIPATAMQTENFETYGVLYNWHAAMQGLVDNQDDVRGVCPEGWRLPNDDDWKELEMRLGMTEQEAEGDGYRGTNQGSSLAGTMVYWFAGYITSDNQFGESGFIALPGGGRYFTGNFDQLGASAIFWTSTKHGDNSAWIRSLHTHYSSAVYRSISNLENGFSVRCIKAD